MMAVKITAESHLDHGLSQAAIDWLLSHFEEKNGFFIESVELPEGLGTVQCGLYGPLCGDEPVPESEVEYLVRGNRDGKSRMVRRPLRNTRKVTVIAGPDGGEPCVLYTTYGGPCAPREPFDSSLSPEQRGESQAFWAQHALALE